MEPTSLQSLRGNRWGGLVETSELSPAAGVFSEMEDCIVSKDGTEIRPAPGTRVCGKPFHGQWFAVSDVTVGVSTTEIEVNALRDLDGSAFLTGAFWVYVPADDTIYAAIRNATGSGGYYTFTITTTTSAVAIAGYVLVRRKHKVHDLATVDGRAAVVVETATYREISTDVYEELRNLATTVCSGPLSIDNPPGPGVPDETDEGFVLWPSVTMAPVNDDEPGHDYEVNVGTAPDPIVATSFINKLRHYDIVRRMQCEPLNGRLAIAVPGMGIMFEADIRRANQWLPRSAATILYHPEPRFTKMLGIPRGYMPNAALADGSTSDSTIALGWYAVAVAYYDPFDDRVGMLSPVQVVEVTNATATSRGIKVVFGTPRSAAWETIGLQTVIYAAGPFDADVLTPDSGELAALVASVKPIAVVGPYNQDGDFGALYNNAGSLAAWTSSYIIATDFNLQAPIRPRRVGAIEVPPPGASWVRSCRGRMFMGAERPAYWDFRALPKTKNPLSTGTSEDFPTESFLTFSHEWNVNQPDRGPMAWGRIPPSYQGKVVAQIDSTLVYVGTIRSVHNGVLGSITSSLPNGQLGPTTLKMDFSFGNVSTYAEADLRSYRVFNRQRGVKFTEEDQIGVSPAINELPVDCLSDTITTGSARLGDSLLLFTPRQSALFSWAAMPRSAAAQIISNSVGCVAAHSIVEGPFGVAWLSHLGPQRWAGTGVEWIGSAIPTTWATVLRDSEGMVPCGGAAVDIERTLVLWGVRVDDTGDWASADTDAKKALVPCDTLLAWNYTSGAWSVLKRRGVQAFEALRTMLLDDGTMRPVLSSASTTLSGDEYVPLYSFDSTNCDRQAPVEAAITTERDTSGRAAITGANVIHVGTGDWAFIRTLNRKSNQWECQWFGKCGGVATLGMNCGETSAEAEGARWGVGDVLVTPCVRFKQTTLRMSGSADGTPNVTNMVAVQADVSATHAFIRITATDQLGNVSYLTPRWGMRMNAGWTVAAKRAVGSDLKLTFEVVADGYVAIKDIRFGAVPG